MGLELDDPTKGDNCALCFAPGETPKYVLASVSGMGTGDLWTPDQPPPPNNIWKLTQEPGGIHCGYGALPFPWIIHFSWMEPQATFTMKYFLIGFGIFTGVGNTPCSNAFGNEINVPTDRFYFGGDCSISWI